MIRQAARLPSKPGRPVAVAEFDRGEGVYVTVEWTRPADDGGGDITGYIIKYGYRLVMGLFPNYDTVKVAGDTTKFQFTDQLKKKKKYQFAVAAVNTAGRGEFSEFSDYFCTSYGINIVTGEHSDVSDEDTNVDDYATELETWLFNKSFPP